MRYVTQAPLLLSCTLSLPAAVFRAGGRPSRAGRAAGLGPPSPLVGGWRGAGTTFRKLGHSKPALWEATIDASWVAQGRGLLEVLTVAVEGHDAALGWVTLHASDAAGRAPAQARIRSWGGMEVADDVRIDGRGAVESTWRGTEAVGAVVDQVLQRVEGDTRTLAIYRSVDGAAPFLHMTGNFERQDEAWCAVDAASLTGAPLVPELEPCQPMVGDWDIEVGYQRDAGTRRRVFTGRKSFVPIASGHGLLATTDLVEADAEGDAPPYSCIGLIGWDAQRQTLQLASADSLGERHVGEIPQCASGRFFHVEPELSGGASSTEVVEIQTKNGRLSRIVVNALAGGGTFHAATATYTPA